MTNEITCPPNTETENMVRKYFNLFLDEYTETIETIMSIITNKITMWLTDMDSILL